MMKRYRLVNNVMGWVAFLIAAVTYCSTVEPTASFWDCPEFITTAFKFEVGHPPGAPFFMVVGNLFTQLGAGAHTAALMVNIMSALMSAAVILFLFWTITHLLRKLICHEGVVEKSWQLVSIIGSGLVGALAYTWSDTFWYSAVEGEVYAFSSLFTAVAFWLILKWEEHSDEPHSDRYIVLISLLMGLSIGVHLLNLLCIPAMVLIYYYKKAGTKSNLKGSLLALVVSFLLIVVVLYGIIPGIPKVAGWFELMFVNGLGLGFYSGEMAYLALLVAVLVWGIWESAAGKSAKRMKLAFIVAVAMMGIPFFGSLWGAVMSGIVILAVLAAALFGFKRVANYKGLARVLNTSLLCFFMLVFGYSTYAIIVIRSMANPPMDQNSPEDVFSLTEYLNRSQYGSTPLLRGQTYNSQLKYVKEDGYYVAERTHGAPIFQKVEKRSADEPDRYEQIGNKSDLVYAQNMIFPRVWDSSHASDYESWLGGVDGKVVEYAMPNGQTMQIKLPTQLDNLRFFFSYQVSYMYWRYFMWNFAGRQNDVQGNGEDTKGNWICGIPFIDNLRLGDQSMLPDSLKNNKGHNVFYMLPLLLGVMGLVWQACRGKKGIRQFWVVFFLFFMTGLAIVIYLNQTPMQPRERDYAYAGSFYAFAIWIGMGVAAIVETLQKVKMNEGLKATVVSLVCLLVPLQMLSQTWDDHDRSGRYTCRDFGNNYLQTLSEEGNPIVFTNGDNDTFPLWYNQETEGVRRDARVCNLSYLQTDWYIDQMCRPAYESPSVPITWNRYEYVNGVNDAVYIHPEMAERIKEAYAQNPEEAKKLFGDNPFELKNILKFWVRSDKPSMNVIPTDSIVVKIDSAAVLRSGMKIYGEIPEYMTISLKGRRVLYKSNLMMLEMLAECNWERPMYIAVTVARDLHLSFGDNFVQEGLAYRITPFRTIKDTKVDPDRIAQVDTDKMYDNMMHKFKFGNVSEEGIYLDETVLRMCLTHRRMFSMLAKALIAEQDTARALAVVEYADSVLPDRSVPYSNIIGGTIDIADVWFACGNPEKGIEIVNKAVVDARQTLEWFLSYSKSGAARNRSDCLLSLQTIIEACDLFQEYGRMDLYSELSREVQVYASRLQTAGVALT